MSFLSFLLKAIFLHVVISYVNSANILCVFPVGGRSHYFLGAAYCKELADRGHNITLISPFEDKKFIPKNGSFRQILLTGFEDEIKNRMKNAFAMSNENYFMKMIASSFIGLDWSQKTLKHPNLQSLFLSKNETFHVVVVEQFMNDGVKYIAHYYGAPLIIFSAIGPNSWINPLVGNSAPPSWVAEFWLGYPNKMSFKQRLFNSVFSVYSQLGNYFIRRPTQIEAIKQFGAVVDYDAIIYNASLVLLNSHPSFSNPVPLVPTMIEIGGFHIKKTQKLPADLQEYLDNSKHGVIYFSMGSNVLSKNMPLEKREFLLKVFASLKENVLWKWEEDILPNQPSNVKLARWLPQSDILAHPNVKLFITHGGLLSTIETLYHGVPIVAIPVFGDQYLNSERAANDGYCISIPFVELNYKTISHGINEILSNPKYRENAKLRSGLMHDRPMAAMDTAVYWTEYVIRNRGAPHLKVAAVDLNWYEYLLLDVIIILIIIFVVITVALKNVCKLILCKPKTNFKNKNE